MAKQVSMLLLSGTINAGSQTLTGSYVNISGYKNVKIEAYSPVATNGTGYLELTNVSLADSTAVGNPDIPDPATWSVRSSAQPSVATQIKEGAIYSVQSEWARGRFYLSAPIGTNAPVYIILTARA